MFGCMCVQVPVAKHGASEQGRSLPAREPSVYLKIASVGVREHYQDQTGLVSPGSLIRSSVPATIQAGGIAMQPEAQTSGKLESMPGEKGAGELLAQPPMC